MNKKKLTPEEEKRKLVEKALKERGYTFKKKVMNYEEFEKLYLPYMTHVDAETFAEILGISYNSWIKIKSIIDTAKEENISGLEALKQRNERIKGELRGKGYINKFISYPEFLELYESYKGEILEEDFALLLGISYSNLYRLSHEKGRKSKVSSIQYLYMSEERRNEIIAEIKMTGYANKLINYETFLMLYAPYRGEISESDFALLLGIRESALRNMRYVGGTAEVFRPQCKAVSRERKQEIQEEIRNTRYFNKLINYEDFSALYDRYRDEMSEEDFALILGITYSNFTGMKNGTKRGRVLKKTEDLESEEKQEKKTSIDDIESQLYEGISPIEVMKLCTKNGIDKKETIDYCITRFNLTKRKLLGMMNQTLGIKERLAKRKVGKVYSGNEER